MMDIWEVSRDAFRSRGLSIRPTDALVRAGLSPGDVTELSDAALLAVPNIGPGFLAEIRAILPRRSLSEGDLSWVLVRRLDELKVKVDQVRELIAELEYTIAEREEAARKQEELLAKAVAAKKDWF